MKLVKVLIGLTLTVLTVIGICCRHVMPERFIDYHQGRVAVDLPRGVRNSEEDRRMDRPDAVIISIPDDGRFYVGKDRAPSRETTSETNYLNC